MRNMFSITFDEFLIATGNNVLLEEIIEHAKTFDQWNGLFMKKHWNCIGHFFQSVDFGFENDIKSIPLYALFTV